MLRKFNGRDKSTCNYFDISSYFVKNLILILTESQYPSSAVEFNNCIRYIVRYCSFV